MKMADQEIEGLTEGPTTAAPDLTALAVTLLRGVIYHEGDPALWNALINLQARVRDYVAVLGLELVLDEAEGYAFLRARANNEDDKAFKLPRLVVRRPLSFSVSLLLALLRKKLAEFDAGGTDTRLVLSRDDVVELIRVFLPDSSNEARLIDQVDAHLNKIADLGFVRRLKFPSPTKSGGQTEMFEVRRILKAFVDAQWLAEFDERLTSYRALLNGNPQGGERDE
jgi:hypothetical protein